METTEGVERVLMARWGRKVSYNDLLKLPKPEQRGSRHNPMPFYQHVHQVGEAAKGKDFEVKDVCYYLNQKDTRMIMTLTLDHPNLAPKKHGDYITALLKTSVDSSWATEMLGGFGTKFCTNGLINNDHKFVRKNTIKSMDSIRLATMDLIGKLPTIVQDFDERWEHYDNYDLSSRAQQNDLLVMAADEEVITYRDIPHVREHWMNPEHDEFKGRNLGNMVQAFTSHQRTKSPFDLADFSGRLTTFVDKYSNRIKVENTANETSNQGHLAQA